MPTNIGTTRVSLISPHATTCDVPSKSSTTLNSRAEPSASLKTDPRRRVAHDLAQDHDRDPEAAIADLHVDPDQDHVQGRDRDPTLGPVLDPDQLTVARDRVPEVDLEAIMEEVMKINQRKTAVLNDAS